MSRSEGVELGQLRDAQWQADVQDEVAARPGFQAGATGDCGKGRRRGRVHGCRFQKDLCARLRNSPLRRPPEYPQKEDGASTRVVTAHTPEAA